MSSSNIIQLRPSQLAKAILQLKGKPLDLENYKCFETIYDVSPPRMVLQCGRQLGKSVSLGAAIIANSIIRPYFSTLFISPLAQQTSRFSTQYLDPFLYSPLVKRHFIDSSSRKNIFEKSLVNGSRITLGYAETEQDADRIRGVAADALYNDEVQDQDINAGEVLEETLSASEYGFRRYTGTAKSQNNTLNTLFERSNMMEWVLKCDHCGKHTIPSTFEVCLKMLENPNGPGCIHCNHVLDMKKGVWMAGRPAEKDNYGFHIPQICIPARTSPKKWKELRDKSKTYSVAKLANEVFGVPSGLSGRILSVSEAMACCNPNQTAFDTGFPVDSRNIILTTMGADWSVSGSTSSYTVFTILGWDSLGKCYLLFTERLDGVDILDQVERAKCLFHQYQCSYIGSDRGVGVLQGQIFQRDLGEDRTCMVQYVAAKNTLRWDKIGGYYAADRTQAIDVAIIRAKMGMSRLETPCWDIMSDYWKDALALTEEITLAGRRVYRHELSDPDDWAHSLVFASVAYMVAKGEFVYIEDKAGAGTTSNFDF